MIGGPLDRRVTTVGVVAVKAPPGDDSDGDDSGDRDRWFERVGLSRNGR